MTNKRKTKINLGGKRPTFEEIALGHTFKLVGQGRIERPEAFHCAFCGGKGQNFCLIERDDGENYKVGANCLQRVGLALKKSTPKLKRIDKTSTPKKIEQETVQKKLEDEDVSIATGDEYDEDFFDEILDKLENK